jgi:hypothetical protein
LPGNKAFLHLARLFSVTKKKAAETYGKVTAICFNGASDREQTDSPGQGGGRMSRNRLLYVLVGLVLLAVATLTIRGVFATSTNVSTADAVSPGSADPPELHNSAQAPDPAGYWNAVTFAAHGLTRGAGSPPELYNSIQAPNLAGYWDAVAPSGARARSLADAHPRESQ